MFKAIAAVSLAAMGMLLVQENDVNLEGVKCVVNGDRGANAEYVAEVNGGKVYFCCRGCLGKFNADQELENPTMTTKANHQMVVTGQFVQKGCPFSGTAVKEGTALNIGGAEVGFCCNNCKGKVEKAEGLAAKAEMVFSKDAFAKGFEKSSDLENVTCPVSGQAVSEEHVSEFGNGKVYFCCGGCKSKFDGDNTKFVTMANHQLFQTGQYTQTGCPFSGGDLDDDQTVEFGGVAVKMCCGNCVKKVNSAADVAAKADLVFNAKSFKRGFAKKE